MWTNCGEIFIKIVKCFGLKQLDLDMQWCFDDLGECLIYDKCLNHEKMLENMVIRICSCDYKMKVSSFYVKGVCMFG